MRQTGRNRPFAVLFAVLMITSVVVGSLTFAGAAAAASGDVLHRANAGGSVSASDGPDWVSDTQYLVAGGATATSPEPDAIDDSVPSGTSSGIWTTERYDPPTGSEMQYEFDVAAGQKVQVRLYFYDGYSETSNPGDRVFDVSVEEQTIQGFDPIAEYGDQTAGMESFTVTSDGTIDVDLAHVTENPQINAIEIVEASPEPGVIDARSSVDFGTVVAGQSSTETVTLTNAGGSGDVTITVDDVTVTGADASEFGVDFAGSTTLAPGETVDVTVTFSPSDATPKSATLEVEHDAPNTASPLTVSLAGEGASDVPVGFGVSGLGADLGNPTSLDFGPDGRLYVAQQSGEIKAFEIARNGPNDYEVTDTEVISAVQDIPNHDDDGTYNPNVDDRQVTGLTVEGTASTPVIYVTSSDPRIGAGGSHTDSGLDTNSGIVSRLTQTDSGWDHDMLVRGLPRSEENHATNGIQYDAENNTLYVAQGGHTNKGAPSDNFALTPEYALSAAILEIDLDQIESMQEKDAANADATYLYDLPTLEDTDKPFGGQDGENMAEWTSDSPVDVYAPGFRNAYDVALSEDGQLYATDNSANPGWGGIVVNEGPAGVCTNEQNEQDEYSAAGVYHIDGEGYYGGHPNPTRGNDASEFAGAVEDGLHDPVNCDYISPTNTSTESAALRTYGPTPQGMDVYPASNFGGAMKGDLLLAMWNSGDVERVELNAEGTEATSSEPIFENIGNNPLDVHAQGDDDAFPGTVWAATYGSNKITVFEPNDYEGSSDGGVCTAATPGSSAYDPNGDADGDGYTNADENAVGTNPCSQASQPADRDRDFVPDSLDDDDDNDGLSDGEDPFAIDPRNGLDNEVPVDRQFEAGQHPQSLFGLGFTGLMTNGTNYADLYNASEVRAGGATERISVDAVPFGDAYANKNSQSYAFQYGVNATGDQPFTVHTTVESPFSDDMTPENWQAAGMQMGPGDQDNYVKLVATAQDATGDPNGGVQFLKEVDGQVTNSTVVSESEVFGSSQTIELYFDVYPSNDTIVASYAIDDGTRTYLDETFPMPESWYANDERGLAVGLISTANGASNTFSASWDRLSVTATDANAAPTADAGSDRTVDEGAAVQLDGSGSVDSDSDQLGYSWLQTAGPDVQLSAQDDAEPSFTAPEVDADTTLTFEVSVSDGTASDTDTVNVTVQDTDTDGGSEDRTVAEAVAGDDGAVNNSEIQQAVNWWVTGAEVPGTGGQTVSNAQVQQFVNAWATGATVTAPAQDTDGSGDLVVAINAGGPEYTAADGTTYQADAYFDGGSTTVAGNAGIPSDLEIADTENDPLYRSERFGTSFGYDVPVEDGTYEVTLEFAEIYQGVSSQDTPDSSGPTDGTDENDRVFDASLEGQQVLSEYDLYAEVGPATAAERTYTVEVTDGTLNVDFDTVTDNAKVSAITVTKVGPATDTSPDGEATMTVNAGEGIDASTYNGGSFEITNTGDTQISSVTYDLSTATLPDVVFDPAGTAGDVGGKGFTPDSGASATGLQDEDGSFAAPHNGQDSADGYDELTVDFADFQSGETFAFSTDIDPTSIKGAQGTGAAGSVSGLELAGATVTVEYADGTTQTTRLFGDGSSGGAQATAKADVADAPALGAQGVSLDADALDAHHDAATVSQATQTIAVSGPAGATVELLHVEGQLELANQADGYDLEQYEANTAENVEYHTVKLGSDGQATVDVTLTNASSSGAEGGFNHFVAAVQDGDGDTGATSNVVVLKYDQTAGDGSTDGGSSTQQEDSA